MWVPEGFTFLGLLANPHFPLALALMVFLLRYVAWPLPGARSWLVPGLLALLLAIVEPFGLVPAGGAIAVYVALRAVREPGWLPVGLTVAAGAGLFSAPVVLYDAVLYHGDPLLAGWAAQNVSLTPSLPAVVVGLGLLGLMALPGAWLALRHGGTGELLLVAWAAATIALAYAPLETQRRFLTGVSIPFGMLAVLGFCRLSPGRASGEKGRLVFQGLAVIGNLVLLGLFVMIPLRQDGGSQAGSGSQLYVSHAEASGMAWLLDHAQGELVLASASSGNLLPGQAGVRVFTGHPAETANYSERTAEAAAFFGGQLSAGAWVDLEQRYHIRYIYISPAERCLAGPGRNSLTPELALATLVFKQDEVTIYRLP